MLRRHCPHPVVWGRRRTQPASPASASGLEPSEDERQRGGER